MKAITESVLVRPAVGKPLPGNPKTCRMFETDFLEKFSRIHPATPFVVYIPVVLAAFYRSHGAGVGIATELGLGAAGLFLWTLAEYVLHRYVFHWTNETSWGRRFHFLAHGVHHDFPSDGDRLVMPLLTSIPLAFIFYGLFYVAFGSTRLADPFFAGFAIGYLAYDGTHYALHHFKQTSRIGKFVKRHHMLHHHADHDGGFGVSTPLWDVIFRTMPQVTKLGATRKS